MAPLWQVSAWLVSLEGVTKECQNSTLRGNKILPIYIVSSAKLVKWQNVKLHFVIWQKNCLCLTSLDDQIFKSFWKPNPWMNFLDFFFLLYHFLFYFLQIKSFPPWMAGFNSNINDLDFVTKKKLKLVKIVANWGHSRWKGLKLQKRSKNWYKRK